MDKTIQITGKNIFYRVYGNGKPVMLVHGFGETGDVWKNQVAFLKDSFLLIVPDLPGSGQSEMINDMSMEGMADILKEILETELRNTQIQLREDADKKEISLSSESSKVSPSGRFRGATMIGHSMGGYITLAFVKKYADYLTAFGLFHSTAYADSEEKKSMRRKGIEFIRKNGTAEFLKTTTPNLFSSATLDKRPQLIDEFLRGLDNFSVPAFVSYYQAMMERPDNTELLKTTILPVLFVIGEYDNAVPIQDSLKLVHLPEKSYIHILHQSGHMGMLEEEEKSNDLLKIFLSET